MPDCQRDRLGPWLGDSDSDRIARFQIAFPTCVCLPCSPRNVYAHVSRRIPSPRRGFKCVDGLVLFLSWRRFELPLHAQLADRESGTEREPDLGCGCIINFKFTAGLPPPGSVASPPFRCTQRSRRQDWRTHERPHARRTRRCSSSSMTSRHLGYYSWNGDYQACARLDRDVRVRPRGLAMYASVPCSCVCELKVGQCEQPAVPWRRTDAAALLCSHGP